MRGKGEVCAEQDGRDKDERIDVWGQSQDVFADAVGRVGEGAVEVEMGWGVNL